MNQGPYPIFCIGTAYGSYFISQTNLVDMGPGLSIEDRNGNAAPVEASVAFIDGNYIVLNYGSGNDVKVRVPATTAGPYTVGLPATPGNIGDVMVNLGNGQMAWQPPLFVRGYGVLLTFKATASGSGTVVQYVGTGSPSLKKDAAVGYGWTSIIGAGTPSTKEDTAAGVGNVVEAIGSGTPSTLKDTTSGSGVIVSNLGTGSSSLLNDTASGTGWVSIVGTGSPSTLKDTCSGTGSFVIPNVGTGTPSTLKNTASGVAWISNVGTGTPSTKEATASGSATFTAPPSAVAFVTGQVATASGSGAGAFTVPVAYPSNTGAGNCLVALVEGSIGTSISISDSQSGTWTLQITKTGSAGSVSLYTRANCTGGALTVTLHTTNAVVNFTILEYSGANTTNPISGSGASNSGFTTSAGPGSVAVANAGSAVIIAYGTTYNATSVLSVTSGFTIRYPSTTGFSFAIADDCNVSSAKTGAFTITQSFWAAIGICLTP